MILWRRKGLSGGIEEIPLTERLQGGPVATCLSGVYGSRSRSGSHSCCRPKRGHPAGGGCQARCTMETALIPRLYFLDLSITIFKLRQLWKNIRSIKADKKADYIKNGPVCIKTLHKCTQIQFKRSERWEQTKLEGDSFWRLELWVVSMFSPFACFLL